MHDCMGSIQLHAWSYNHKADDTGSDDNLVNIVKVIEYSSLSCVEALAAH